MTITLDGTTGITTPGLTNTGTSTFTSVAVSGAVTLSGGTANGVAYLDGSKVLTTGTALTFNGATFTSTGSQGLLNTVGGNTARMVATAAGTYFGSTTAADVIFQQNSTEGMRLTSTGLGIGTSSPGYKLEVNGGSYLNGNILTQAGSTFYNATGDLYIRAGTGGTLRLGANGSNSLITLSSGGNVVINAPSSGYALTINGVATAVGLLQVTGTPGASQGVLKAQAGSGATLGYNRSRLDLLSQAGTAGWSLYNYGDGGDLFAISVYGGSDVINVTQAGNLGIGTSSPAYKLDVNGVANFAQNVGHRVGTVLFFASAGTSAGLNYLYTHTTAMAWRNAADSAELMRLDNSGNLLVGTTSSGGKLCLQVGATGTGIVQRWAATGGTAEYFEVNSVNVGSITTSTTATAYNTSSDYRLKNITGPITNSGAYIDSLKPVEGTWKADGSTFVGLIAHEVQEASRTVVATGTKDGEEMQGMDYSSAEIIANLIAEIQSLRVRLNALESK